MKLSAPLAALVFAGIPLLGAGQPEIEQQFEHTVRPYVTKYCVGCHSGSLPAAQFDLKSFTSLSQVTEDFPRWSLMMERLTAKEMPPKPIPAPPAEATAQVIAWIQAVRAEEIHKYSGDPGLVLSRRLSNSEYNYTIRDLTGQDMKITRQFPVDPANQAGFDNSGESLTMSPSLLNKYLQAAREVSNHMVLTPDAIGFAPFPMLVETDREKFAIQQIIEFYKSQPTDYAKYFEAAWQYRYRATLGTPNITLAATATAAGLSPKYLPLVWQILHDPHPVGPVLKLQTMWRALPAPSAGQTPSIAPPCAEMSDFVTRIRFHTSMQFAAPTVKGLPAGSQPLLNWKLRQYASHRRASDPAALLDDDQPPPPVPDIPKYPGLHREAAPRWAALMAKARAGDTDLIVPAAQRKLYEASFARFASVFPDKFYITERGRYFPDDSDDKGRLLSAGYHSVVGFFRDDTPLVELVLDTKRQSELNRLWEQFDFVANFTARTWTQYFFNQSGEVLGKGAESASPRPVGHQITDTPVIFAMRDAYLAKARALPTNDPTAPTAIADHFNRMNATLRHLEAEHKAAESRHLAALLQFAERAYRRPLTKAESTDLLAFYHELRDKKDLSHEDAVRDSIVSVLMSPDFLYRLDLSEVTSVPSRSPLRPAALKDQPLFTSEPLPAYALASRLSYFLWSSMPDQELLQHAAAGDLQKPEVLRAQANRMMKDPRVQGLATEFTANWLGSRQFETNNSVDRGRFPTFNDDLREAMFQEPVRFMQNLISTDRPVLDLIYGRYTFVNPPLARHYGMPEVSGDATHWVRVDDAATYGRGGLLPMAVFLTQNSPGLRTSPVKRGNWVVQRVLGIKVPPPPPVVPELPSDEAHSDLPVRDMLARHRSNPVCAGCHARFDSFGLAFESYGPVGDARTKDLAGRPVDTAVTYPGGVEGSGFPGLQEFIRGHREDQFLTNLCRKLLAYSLARSLQLSDESLIDAMKVQLATQQYHFSGLVDTIVASPQFMSRRTWEKPNVSEARLRAGKVN